MTPANALKTPFGIFNAIGLIQTHVILKKLTPDEDGFLGKTKKWLLEKERAVAYGGEPEKGLRIQDVVDYNKFHRKWGTDINEGGNIGLLDDWFSDRRFAEQQFTGTNPATITQASAKWIKDFTKAAKAGKVCPVIRRAVQVLTPGSFCRGLRQVGDSLG